MTGGEEIRLQVALLKTDGMVGRHAQMIPRPGSTAVRVQGPVEVPEGTDSGSENVKI